MVQRPVNPQQKTGEPATAAARPFCFIERLREISMFFDGTDRVHQTMRTVAGILDKSRIPYAIDGGMAVNAHRYVRTTGDVDFLVTAESLSRIRSCCTRCIHRRTEPPTPLH